MANAFQASMTPAEKQRAYRQRDAAAKRAADAKRKREKRAEDAAKRNQSKGELT